MTAICHIQFQWKVTEHFWDKIKKIWSDCTKIALEKKHLEIKNSHSDTFWFLYVTVFPVKRWTPEKISGMFVVSRPIRCKIKLQKITDKPQQGSVMTWYETWTSWLFLLQEIFNFPFGSLWKGYFFTTNLHQSFDSIWSKTKLLQSPKSDCKLWKFTTVQVSVLGEGFSAKKIYRSKTTNHSQLAWPFELYVKQTPRSIACDWLIFSCSEMRCLAVSDPVFLVNFAFP